MQNLSLSNDKTNFYANSLPLFSGAFIGLKGPEDMASPGEAIDDTATPEWSVEGPEEDYTGE